MTIGVEVIYAQPSHSASSHLSLRDGALLGEALHAAAEGGAFAGVDWANAAVGIFGRVAALDQPLKDGDRIEIYRPLTLEPKLARRQRVNRSGRS